MESQEGWVSLRAEAGSAIAEKKKHLLNIGVLFPCMSLTPAFV